MATAWRDAAFADGSSTGPILKPQNDCPNVNTRRSVGTVGGAGDSLPFGMSCTAAGDSSTGDIAWSMTNKAYVKAALGLVNSAVLYHFSTSGLQYAAPPAITSGGEDNVILQIIIAIAHQDIHAPYVFPGEALQVHRYVGFQPTRVDATADPLATAAWGGVNNILDLLPDAQAESEVAKFLGTESMLSGCVAGLANSLGCIKDLVAAAVDYVVHHPGAISSKAILKRVTSANLFRKGFAAAQWFGSFAAAIAFQNIGGTGVSLNDQPTRPSQDRSRRPLNGSCLSHTDTTWIIDNVCQDALDAPPTSGAGNGTSNSAGGADGTIVNDTDSAGHILFRLANGSSESVPYATYRDPKVAFDVVLPGGKEDAATHQCLARRMPLRDWLPCSKLTD